MSETVSLALGLVGQQYSLRSVSAAAQTCINLYPELIQDPNERAKNKAFLYGIPGRHLFKDLTTIDAAATPIRGIWTGAGRCFVAAGTKYMELDSSGALVGSVRTISNAAVNGLSNSPVQFFPNGNQLLIIAGGLAYVDNGAGPVQVSLGGSFSGLVNTYGYQVSWVSGDKFDPGMVGASITIPATTGTPYTITSVPDAETIIISSTAGVQILASYSSPAVTMNANTGAFLDGYFIAQRPNSRQYNISAVNNSTGTTWNGLDFGSKDSWPDKLRCVVACEEQLYLFGDESMEVHQNTGASSFPFQRIDGATHRIGCVSPWSPIEIQGKVFFLSSSSSGQPVAYMMNGFTPTRISQHAQEQAWGAAGLGPNCISYGYTEEGHVFWVTNFGSQTWAYDLSTGAWHRRAAGSNFTAYPTAYHSYIPEFNSGAGLHLTGGPLDGKIYSSSVSYYDDAGSDITWQRALPFVYSGRHRIYDYRLELEMETGTAPSGTPVVTMDYSDDRGHTFGTSETASIGSSGQYSQRVFWTALGSYYERVYRFTGTGQGRVALIDLQVEQEVGTT
jgi:hypothetical protein